VADFMEEQKVPPEINERNHSAIIGTVRYPITSTGPPAASRGEWSLGDS